MNELAIGRRKDAAIFRQQGTVKAEKKAAATSAQKAEKPVSSAASDSVRQRMTGSVRAEALSRESRRTLQTGEAVLSEIQERLGRLAELAEKAAGGGEEDRAALQKELTRLLGEIDRMAGSAAGDKSLFLSGDPDAAGGADALPAWLLNGIAQGAVSPERLLSALGLDQTASGADILAAIMGSSPEGNAAVGYLAALYLGAVISGGGQTENPDPSLALDGLRQLLAAVESGVPLDRAVELLTGGEFTSLSDFQNQFTQGTIPGMEDFLTNLLLSGGDSPLGEGQSLLALLAATFDGMGPDLLMDLLAALPVPGAAAAPDPASSGPDAALAESAPGLADSSGASPVSLLTFGNVQVMGRDLSGVSLDANGVLTIGGTADVTVLGTGQGGQALRLTGSGAVILRNADVSTLTAAAPEARVVSAGGNTIGTVQLGENAALTLDGGLLRLGSVQGGAHSLLRLAGGAAVLLGKPAQSGETVAALTVPVVLDGPASLMARASVVRDTGGKALQPFDVVWKALLPGFRAITSLEIDGQRSRLSLTRDQAMRLWLAKGDLSNQGYPAHSLVIRGRDRMGRLRTRYAYLRWDQRTGGFEETELYPNPFTVTGGEPGEDWVYEEGSHTLHILSAQVSAISGGSGVDADQSPFSGRIVLADSIGAIELALRGVACRVTSGRAFYLGCGNDVTLLPEGGTANFFESGADCAGISVGEGTSLRVDCTRTNGLPAGTITASGGTSIGGDRGRIPAGRILIRGGAVTGGERRGSTESVTIVGGMAPDNKGGAKVLARMGVILQAGEDILILPRIRLSAKSLRLDGLCVSTREQAHAAVVSIEVGRRWIARLQDDCGVLSGQVKQSGFFPVRHPAVPVRDASEAGILLENIGPISFSRAMRLRSGRKNAEDVEQLLR